jgi:ribosomal protein S6--L-glutamate ligase
LEGVEGATGVDVAGKIIEFLENHGRPNKTRDRVRG